jgi:hypothetical protein
MEQIYIVLVALAILASVDLMVGVANDAVRHFFFEFRYRF